MKNFKYLFSAIAFLSLTATSCKDGSFGGDYEVEGVALQEMCGTWVCTVEANDPWFYVNYYAVEKDVAPEVLNGAYGDPYGTTNPDANEDGVVDEKDFDLYTANGLWEVLDNAEFTTSNTASNGVSEMLITDKFWGEAYKVNVSFSDKTFSTSNSIVDAPYQTLEVTPHTVSKQCLSGEKGDKPVILNGKILKGAAHAPGSGMQTDSIFFYVKYADDYGQDIYYRVSGYLKTGHAEDK